VEGTGLFEDGKGSAETSRNGDEGLRPGTSLSDFRPRRRLKWVQDFPLLRMGKEEEEHRRTINTGKKRALWFRTCQVGKWWTEIISQILMQIKFVNTHANTFLQ
jgi:hypothetical protein